MNILIPDSWLRDHLKTTATNREIAKILSLTSVSVERITRAREDSVMDIEVTTNRPDLMSIVGIAKEAAVALKEHGVETKFIPLSQDPVNKSLEKFPIEIKSDPSLVNRICAVVMDVSIGESPKKISERLEASGIRSLNNLIDVTNYVMRETGHPTHVFDFDRLNTKTLTIRRSEAGEVIETLDGRTHNLLGDDIVAVDERGEIVDLLGVMGTQNSVVTNETKKILFFVDNNNPINIRNTSMNLGIRTEAAVINEKRIDPNLSIEALNFGINLYEKIADGKIASEVLDIYPNKPSEKLIKVNLEKINKIIGVDIPEKKSIEILEGLGFKVESESENLSVTVPTSRINDVDRDEDVIEEVARIYGYHKLPSVIPTFLNNKPYKFDNSFYFENKLKNAMKYLGFDEVYTYSLVSEELFEGSIDTALQIKNPLSSDMAYLRISLVPSLLAVLDENKKQEKIKIFELANTYHKKTNDLPTEKLTFAGAVKKQKNSFFEVKGIIEAVLEDLGIRDLNFIEKSDGIVANVYKGRDLLGYIEVFDNSTIDFEFDFELILKHSNVKKSYKPLAKFPPIIEDLSIEVEDNVRTMDLINNIKAQSELISEVGLLDEFGSKKTFHIIYQDIDKNLTSIEVSKIREKIIISLQTNFKATIK